LFGLSSPLSLLLGLILKQANTAWMIFRAFGMQGRIYKTQKKIRIVEIHERLIVLRRVHTATVWCQQCRDKQPMVRPETAAALSFLPVGEIYEMLDSGRLHCRTEGNLMLVCVASIPACEESEL
jgi:hypothetical protein